MSIVEAPLFAPPGQREYPHPSNSYKRVITDRGSKYTVSGGSITSRDEGKQFMKKLLSDSTFSKATHNTYAWRILDDQGFVVEGKNDDGETGAGNCILRELQRSQCVNVVVVVTRYYGGVKLMNDRFRHVVDATRIFLGKIG